MVLGPEDTPLDTVSLLDVVSPHPHCAAEVTLLW